MFGCSTKLQPCWLQNGLKTLVQSVIFFLSESSSNLCVIAEMVSLDLRYDLAYPGLIFNVYAQQFCGSFLLYKLLRIQVYQIHAKFHVFRCSGVFS